MRKHSVNVAWQDALLQALVAENEFGSTIAMRDSPAIQFNNIHEIKSSGRNQKDAIETAAVSSVQAAPIPAPAKDRRLREQLAEKSISPPQLTWEQRLSLSRVNDSSAAKTTALPAVKPNQETVRHAVEYRFPQPCDPTAPNDDLDLQLQGAVAKLEGASGGRETAYEFARNDHRMEQPDASNTAPEIKKDRWLMQGIIAFATAAIGGSILLFITLLTLQNSKAGSNLGTRDGREVSGAAAVIRTERAVFVQPPAGRESEKAAVAIPQIGYAVNSAPVLDRATPVPTDHSLSTISPASANAATTADDELRGSIMTVGDGVMIAGLPIAGQLLGDASGKWHRLIVSGLPSDAMLLIGERSNNTAWIVEADGLTHIGMMFPKRPAEDVVIELELQTREGKFVPRGRGRISVGSKNAVTFAAAMSRSLKPETTAAVSNATGSKPPLRDEVHQQTEIVLKSASENRGTAGVIAQALLPSREPQLLISAPQFLGAQAGMADEKGPATAASAPIAPPRKRPPPAKADTEQDAAHPGQVRKPVRIRKASTTEPRSPKTTTETPPAKPTASLWSSPSPTWRESLFGADKN